MCMGFVAHWLQGQHGLVKGGLSMSFSGTGGQLNRWVWPHVMRALAAKFEHSAKYSAVGRTVGPRLKEGGIRSHGSCCCCRCCCTPLHTLGTLTDCGGSCLWAGLRAMQLGLALSLCKWRRSCSRHRTFLAEKGSRCFCRAGGLIASAPPPILRPAVQCCVAHKLR